MKFRLTYEGPLRATQGEAREGQRNPLAAHKHSIRQAIHGQLKQLWATNKFLRDTTVSTKPGGGIRTRKAGDLNAYYGSDDTEMALVDVVASAYEQFGYRFVPLVRDEYQMLCSLHVLLLRRDAPGAILTSAGDIDNRIKTLIDGLRRPRSGNELAGNETPKDGENPFFCLLEDDSQITHLEVETDYLLDPLAGDKADQSYVRAIITVELRPYFTTMFNLGFI